MGDAATAALDYLRRGYAPIPIARGQKGPKLANWTQWRVTSERIPDYWPADENVGIVLGSASGGLVDLDLDCPEACQAAEAFLPRTGAIFGRASKPRSHWLYRTTRLLDTEKFTDPAPDRARGQRAVLLELRAEGAQTVFPPSEHSGERVAWAQGDEPTLLEGPELREVAARLAACALLARHWFDEGDRHRGALALGGMLARAGWLRDDAVAFVGTAASIAGDEEVRDRMRAVEDSFDRLDDDEPLTGIPTLEELLRDDLLRRLIDWTHDADEMEPRLLVGKFGAADYVHSLHSLTKSGADGDAEPGDDSVYSLHSLTKNRASRARTHATPEKTSGNAKNAGNGERETREEEKNSSLSHGVQVDITEEWGAPLPFIEYTLPAFPVRALPSWLGAFVQAQATALQVPVDVPAMVALATLSTCCAKRVVVGVRDGWVEPTNLYTVVCLPPGERKSGVFQALTQPLFEHQEALQRRFGPQIAEAENRRKILEASLTRLQQDAARAAGAERDMKVADADQAARQLATAEVPGVPRLVAEDSTPERLTSLLAQHGGRIAVLSDEGDVFDLMAGRYTSGAPNFSIFLKAHSGTDYLVDRVGRPSEHIKAPALTLGLTVQPDVIAGLSGKQGFRGKGLLARFLFALPTSHIGHREDDPPAVAAAVREEYRFRVLALLNLETTEAQDLALSPEAADVFARFRRWLEPQLGDAGPLVQVRDWGGKLAGAVARIAGLLHMAALAGDVEPWLAPIGAETMTAAVEIGAYLIPHAQAAFGMMGADQEVEAAKHILAWIKRKRLGRFKRSECYADLRARFGRVDAVDAPLAILADHACIRPVRQGRRAGPGRKPSPEYEVNPALCAAEGEGEPW